tara:strand:+ start:73 stop:273 length:201 start_codon:yes stop_codon:yes gene_type:complete
MNTKIPQEDIDLINCLMKERRNLLYQDGPNSENFIEINNKFEKLLNKYNLEHTELSIGFMNKKRGL